MAEPAVETNEVARKVPSLPKRAVDRGLEQGVNNLNREKIERVVNEVLSAETGARLKAYIETCVHCGLCSDACHFYLSHDKDPVFSRDQMLL